MKKLLLVLAVAMATGPALAAPPAGFNERVEALRKSIGVPGMAIAIVEDGKPTLARGYGVRKLGESAPVDADTLFPIGSTTKAMTAAALATLVDAGKIGWDDKVIDHLPGFQMYDPWVTREITIRDLLVHRSGLGLGAGDLLYVPRSNLSRAETIKRLRFIQPKTSFRTTYAYTNLMYMVAGQVIESVSGERWEEYVRNHLLLPAGMATSTTERKHTYANVNRAYPHARMNGGVRGAGDQERLDEPVELERNSAPSGGVSSSANDLTKWMQIMLGAGTSPAGKQIFSAQQHAQLWKPVTLMPISPQPPELKATEPQSLAYALGWDVTDYRGAKMIWHSGAVFGFQTVLVFLPEQKVAFSITINSEDGEILLGLMDELLDHYLGLPKGDWPAKFRDFKAQKLARGLKGLKEAGAEKAPAATAMPATELAGTYADPWYGNIEVGKTKEGLTIDFKSTPRMNGRLEHWQYNTFITRFNDKAIEPALVTFALDAEGKVERVTMKAASPIADFSYDYQDLLFKPVKAVK